MPEPVISPRNDGEVMWFGGGAVTFKATSAQTGGLFSLIENVMPRGKTTPLHLHPTFDETLYVTEGEILAHVDGREVTVSAGTSAFIPRGVPHAFLVTSESATILAFATPGDVFEAFFRAGGEPAADPNGEPPPLDIAKVKAAGESTGGMKVLGPPPFATANV
jgi:quercetin dioxygenase-like cupin family protein